MKTKYYSAIIMCIFVSDLFYDHAAAYEPLKFDIATDIGITADISSVYYVK